MSVNYWLNETLAIMEARKAELQTKIDNWVNVDTSSSESIEKCLETSFDEVSAWMDELVGLDVDIARLKNLIHYENARMRARQDVQNQFNISEVSA